MIRIGFTAHTDFRSESLGSGVAGVYGAVSAVCKLGWVKFECVGEESSAGMEHCTYTVQRSEQLDWTRHVVIQNNKAQQRNGRAPRPVRRINIESRIAMISFQVDKAWETEV